MPTTTPETHPRLPDLRDAVERLGGEVLWSGENRVALGVDELELLFPWGDLERFDGPAALGDRIVEAQAEARAVEDDWESSSRRLMPVLFNQAAGADLARRAPQMLAFPFAETLFVALAQDVPRGLRLVQKPEPAAWGVTPEAALQQALGNLQHRTAPEAVEALEDDLYALHTGDGLDSSRLLMADQLRPGASTPKSLNQANGSGDSPDGATHGVVVAVPARESLAFVPFTAGGMQRLRALILLAHNGVRRLPQPLAGDLFYIGGGQALRIAVEPGDDGKPKVSLPQALAEIQMRLVQAGRWETD